jgi:hypothetical protein
MGWDRVLELLGLKERLTADLKGILPEYKLKFFSLEGEILFSRKCSDPD